MVKKAKKRGSKRGSRWKARAEETVQDVAKRQAMAERARGARLALGLSQQQVADMSGTSYATVRRIENADRPNVGIGTLRKVAAVLNCTVELLVSGIDYEQMGTATPLLITMRAALGIFSVVEPQVSLGVIEDARPLDERFANVPRRGVIVDDDSLEGCQLASVKKGYIARVILFADANVDIENGYVYLLSQKNSDGQEELAFRRATVYRDFVEFRPVTGNPKRDEDHKITISREALATETTIKIIGIFYSASTPQFVGPVR